MLSRGNEGHPGLPAVLKPLSIFQGEDPSRHLHSNGAERVFIVPGEFLPTNYLPVLIFMLVALAFGAVSLLVAKMVRPSRPYAAKVSTYESGSVPFSDARNPFPMRYYIIAMLFVIFDIETVFLYPWAVSFKKLGLFGLVEMVLFILILFVGYVYAWKKGALEWD